MPTKREVVAQQVIEVIPLVARTLASELRRPGHTLSPVFHCGLLAILASRQHNLSELAEKHGVSAATTSDSITALVGRGWVSRVRDPHDRRRVLIELTPAGRDVFDVIRSAAEARVAELLASLSSDECDQLLAGLAMLRTILARGEDSTQSSEWERNLA